MIRCVAFVSCYKCKTNTLFHYWSPYRNVGEVRIQNTPVFIIPPMHLQKVRAEVLYDRFIVIRSLPERCDAVFN